MKKLLSILTIITVILCMFTMTVSAAKEEAIQDLNLTVTAPIENQKPDYTKIDGRGYYSDNGLQGSSTRIYKNGIAWFKSSSSYFSPGTTAVFEADKTYTVKINLLPKGNFEFADNLNAKINGKTAAVETYDDGSILVVANLTSPKKEQSIEQVDVTVKAPSDGEKPDYTKLDGTGYFSDNGINGVSTRIYKNGIAWFKSSTSYISPGTTETFKGDTDYTVKIALTNKEGYKFAQNLTAKINGKAAAVELFDDGSAIVSTTLTATAKNHVHTESAWKTDAEYHWKICTDKECGSLLVKSQEHTDSNKDGKCDVCSHKMPTNTSANDNKNTESEKPIEKPIASKPVASKDESSPADISSNSQINEEIEEDTANTIGALEENTTNNEQPDGNGYILWIIIGVAVVIAGAIVVVMVLKKKKG